MPAIWNKYRFSIVILVLLVCLIFSPRNVLALSPDELFQNQKVEQFRKANLPPVDINKVDTSVADIFKLPGNYNFSDKSFIPGNPQSPNESSITDWFRSILDLTPWGNQKSADFLCKWYPTSANCSSTDMTKSYTQAQCTVLPGGCASNGAPNIIGQPGSISPPVVTSSPNQPPITPHDCPLGTGYCSVSFLITPNPTSGFPGFAKDVNDVKVINASKICNVESEGGHPDVINSGCISGKSADYSVGLFQLNMLPADRCPGAFSSYTLNPPSCTIKDPTILQSCVDKYKDPDTNIKTAYDWSSGGTDWKNWSAAYYCGIVK